VTISVAQAFGRHFVLPALADFRSAYPEIHVEMKLVEGIEDLIDNNIDLVIRQGSLPDSSIVARRLGSVDLIMAMPAHFRQPNTLADLQRLPAIAFRIPGTGQLYRWMLERGGEQTLVSPDDVVMTLGSIEAVADMICLGFGAAPVPRFLVAQASDNGRVHQIMTEYKLPTLPIHLCFGSKELMPKRVRLLADFLAARLGPLLR
jgi:LysR family transcriptional regulator, regulator for bpeEF and oprC